MLYTFHARSMSPAVSAVPPFRAARLHRYVAWHTQTVRDVHDHTIQPLIRDARTAAGEAASLKGHAVHRKVYGILAMQMAVTAAVAGYVVLTPGVAQWISATPGMLVLATFSPIISTWATPPSVQGRAWTVVHILLLRHRPAKNVWHRPYTVLGS
jgi:hypothetical protein